MATIGNDINYDRFFISPKESQWLHPVTDYVCEGFSSNKPLNWPNLCIVHDDNKEDITFTFNSSTPSDPNGNNLHGYTARIGKGNSGKYKWDIVLPKKPSGDLNITVQCGILKPNETDIDECAGETGEVVGPSCTRGQGPSTTGRCRRSRQRPIRARLPRQPLRRRFT